MKLAPVNFFVRLLKRTLFALLTVYSCSAFSQSNTRLDSLKIALNEETNDSLKITNEIELSRELHRKRHNEKEEYGYAEDAVERALQFKDTLLYATALDNFGLLYRFHQHYEQGLDLHVKAFNLIENKKVKPYYKMRFANNAGVAARYHQKYALSVFYFMKGLKIADRENDLRNISISSNGIGNALGFIPGREDEALQYFERALATEKSRGNTLGMSINYLSICNYYINEEDYDTAHFYLDELLKVNTEREDEFGLAITYQLFGLAYSREGKDLEKAASYFKNAFVRFRILNNRHKLSEILISLGNIEMERKNFEQAEDHFLESLALAKELKQNELVRQSSMKLFQISENRSDYKQALYFYKQSKAYEDSIKLTDQNVRIEALTRKYSLEKKEDQIQLLEKDKALQLTAMEIQEQQSERRRITMILLAIGFALLLMIFIMQYRNYRIKKKTTALIQQEEKAKINAIYERNLAQAEILVTRLRINPHFLFNSLNAITYLIQSEQNATAIKYLVVFSRYTRMVLETSQNHVVPLQEELKLAEYYLTLEENRFTKNFTFSITGADAQDIDGVVIPPLLLQPFIENAIWHGLLPSKRDVKTLEICVLSEEDNTQIIIEDNGVGRKKTLNTSVKNPHKSMGVQIIKERIELFNQSYSEKINYEIVDKTDKEDQPLGTKVIVNLLQD